MKKDKHFTSINTDALWYENEPYVLADQVKQVFYIDDNMVGDPLKVVQRVNHHHIWENVPKSPEVDDAIQIKDVKNDTYQELISNEVDIAFDTTTVEAPLNRTDIGLIQIDALYINLSINVDDAMHYESNVEWSDEENDVESDRETDVESDDEVDDDNVEETNDESDNDSNSDC